MSLLIEALKTRALSHPNDIALSDAQTQLTYHALWRAIDEAASWIRQVCQGSAPIALCGDNAPAWVVFDLACVRLGRTLVPLPPFFTEQQIDHIIKQTGAGFLVTCKSDGQARAFDLLENTYLARELAAAPVVLPAGTAKVTYTSGTTGTPKGVCLSQDALERVSASLVEAIGTEFAGTHLTVLPLGVLLENVAGLYTTLLAGGRYHVLRLAEIGFAKPFLPDFAQLATVLAQTQARSVILVPEILRGLIQALTARKLVLTQMRLVAVGGAKVAPALLETAAHAGLPVYQGYGLSEAGSVVTLNTPRKSRVGSVGRILGHVNLSIDTAGEILLREPGFLGYAGEGAAPSVYRTGDLGRVDADGFLYIDGRASNVLITSFGRNVSPEWVESELLAQPEIAQAFVCGEAMPSLGALLVPSSLQIRDADLERAVANANKTLPAYAQINHWSKVFPFTPANGQATSNGRLKRSAINAAYARQIARTFETQGQYLSFFERLVAATEAERGYLMQTPQIRDGLQGKISLRSYRAYLAEAYYHVRHTVPLLERVRDLLPPEKAWLSKAAEEYIAEESGHEEWVLDDIRNAGGDADAVRLGDPREATEMMVAYAYDFVNRRNPAGFFGMVFVLEGTSMQLATAGAGALMQSLKLPENCFRYLTSHGTLDISHMQFFRTLMDRIDDPRDQADIIHMAKRMFVLFANVFRAIPHEPEVQHAAA